MTIKVIYSPGIKVFYAGIVFKTLWYYLVITSYFLVMTRCSNVMTNVGHKTADQPWSSAGHDHLVISFTRPFKMFDFNLITLFVQYRIKIWLLLPVLDKPDQLVLWISLVLALVFKLTNGHMKLEFSQKLFENKQLFTILEFTIFNSKNSIF